MTGLTLLDADADELQRRLRNAHRHLGVSPNADVDRLAAHSDLAVAVELLAPLGSLA